jgi:hypothetical protein
MDTHITSRDRVGEETEINRKQPESYEVGYNNNADDGSTINTWRK